jgi:NAD(P)-dependent dehydrogenase (short-subunit alcohol dehydrogenase family)
VPTGPPSGRSAASPNCWHRRSPPLGIKIVSVEPGGMRTNWGEIARGQVPDILPDYIASVGALTDLLATHIGQEVGEPAKVAQIILGLAAHDSLPAQLLLGRDAVHYFGQAAAEAWRPVSLSTDFAASDPIPPFPTTDASR